MPLYILLIAIISYLIEYSLILKSYFKLKKEYKTKTFGIMMRGIFINPSYFEEKGGAFFCID